MKASLIALFACCAISSMAIARMDDPGMNPPHFTVSDDPGMNPPHFTVSDDPGMNPPHFTVSDDPGMNPPHAQ